MLWPGAAHWKNRYGHVMRARAFQQKRLWSALGMPVQRIADAARRSLTVGWPCTARSGTYHSWSVPGLAPAHPPVHQAAHRER
eukprot:4945627-Amphidinium_carterae.1